MPKMKTHSGTGEAVPADRYRQGNAPPRQPRPPVRAQAVPPDAAAYGEVLVAPSDRKEIKKLLGK